MIDWLMKIKQHHLFHYWLPEIKVKILAVDNQFGNFKSSLFDCCIGKFNRYDFSELIYVRLTFNDKSHNFHIICKLTNFRVDIVMICGIYFCILITGISAESTGFLSGVTKSDEGSIIDYNINLSNVLEDAKISFYTTFLNISK